MKKLTKEQLLALHDALIEATGGSEGLRDEGLLESAMNAPFQGFDEIDSYPSIQQKSGTAWVRTHSKSCVFRRQQTNRDTRHACLSLA